METAPLLCLWRCSAVPRPNRRGGCSAHQNRHCEQGHRARLLLCRNHDRISSLKWTDHNEQALFHCSMLFAAGLIKLLPAQEIVTLPQTIDPNSVPAQEKQSVKQIEQ